MLKYGNRSANIHKRSVKGVTYVFYRGELDLLQDTLIRAHIPVCRTGVNASVSDVVTPSMSGLLPSHPILGMSIGEYLGSIRQNTLYRSSDFLHLGYIYFLLPAVTEENLLFIGPYLTEQPTESGILTAAETAGISPQIQKQFRDYYTSITCVPGSSPVFLMVEAFCDRIWGKGKYNRLDATPDSRRLFSGLSSESAENIDASLVDAMVIDKRYAFENELLQAISFGQTHRIEHLMDRIAPEAFESRVQDPLRNMKNYCIVMNTLFRKAAERGGVHPYHLHRISIGFAAEIEQAHDIRESTELMQSIFRTYTRLVRTYSAANCCEHVRKALVIIESNLSSSLSPAQIADSLKITPAYLARIFKRDTGKTVVEYILQCRIRQAKHLLQTTALQVQTVAQHCGMIDVQYFSKLFKSQTGMSPRQYREQKQGRKTEGQK